MFEALPFAFEALSFGFEALSLPYLRSEFLSKL